MQIELLKPHTHVGKAYAPGAVITLDDDLAQWLVKAGVARVPAPQKPLPKHEEKSQ
jgi:endonuclease YncB( thermonuclease family)